SAGPARDVVDEITNAGGRAIMNTDSVATQAGCRALVEKTLHGYGRVAVLVHNAGRNFGAFDDIMNVHVGAAHWLTDSAWPLMTERGYGRIVLTTSAAGLYGDGTGPGPNPKQPYATAKAAVIGLTRSLGTRGRPADIRVNAISPTADTRLVGLNRGIENTRAGAPSSTATPDWVSANAPASVVAAGALWLMHESWPVAGGLYA